MIPVIVVPSVQKASKCCGTNNEISARRYQTWKGKNVFLCGGRLLLGAHTSHLTITLVLVILSWVEYALLVIPFLNFSSLYAVPLVMGTINAALLFCTAFADPGILPRQHFQNGKQAGASSIRKDAVILKSNFCRICNIWRPYRARHCKYCDNCVDIFDHHCPWTGTCIGIRNYPQFLLFIISLWIGAAVVLLSSVFMLVSWVVGGATTDRHYLRVLSLALTIPWTCLVLFMVGTLLSFHLYLIFRGQTTNEYFRERRARQVLASPPGSPVGQNKVETTAERLINNNANTAKTLMVPPSRARCWKMILWKADGRSPSGGTTGPGNLATQSSSNSATLGSAHTSRSPQAIEGAHLPPISSNSCAPHGHKDYISSLQATETVLTPLYDAESTPFPQLSPNTCSPESPDYMDTLQYQPLSLHVGVSPRGVSRGGNSAEEGDSTSPVSSPDDLSTSPEEKDPFASLSPKNKAVLSQMRANLAQHRRNLTIGIGAGAHNRVPSLTLIFPQSGDEEAHPGGLGSQSPLQQGPRGQTRSTGGASEALSVAGSTNGSVMSTLACLPCGAVACALRLCGCWRPNNNASFTHHTPVPNSPSTPAVQDNVRYTYCYLCFVVPVIPRSKLLPLWRRPGPEDTEQQQYLLEKLLEKIREAQRWDDEMFNDHSV